MAILVESGRIMVAATEGRWKVWMVFSLSDSTCCCCCSVFRRRLLVMATKPSVHVVVVVVEDDEDDDDINSFRTSKST